MAGSLNNGDPFTFTFDFTSSINLIKSSPTYYISNFNFVTITATQGSSLTTTAQALLDTNVDWASSTIAEVINTENNQLNELKFTINSIQQTIYPTRNDYLVIELYGVSTAFSSNIISGIAAGTLIAQIDCVCYINQTTLLSGITCYQHY